MPTHQSSHRKQQHTSAKNALRRRAQRTAALTCAVSLTLLMLVVALAAPADLDLTFDADGRVTTDFGNDTDQANAMAIQTDGKIVTAGSSFLNSNKEFSLARYNADGSLDTTFDTDGKLTTDFSDSFDAALAVAIQPDGKIVAAGLTFISTNDGASYDFALTRYNADGSLDPTFDADGKVTTDFGNDTDQALAVAIQPDGKIVAVGVNFTRVNDSANYDFALARYNADGSLDTTFDTDGKVTTDFGPSFDVAYAVALQPDGKIVVAGCAPIESSDDFALARYNADGSLDTTFDGDGKVTTNFGPSNDAARAMAIQPDGKIVAAGRAVIDLDYQFLLARYNADGSLDTTFDTDGKLTTDFGSNNDAANAVALQPDGKIVAAGRAYTPANNGASYDFALARYNADGSLDTTFDADGKLTTDFDSFNDAALAVAIQPDGKIVAAGVNFTIVTNGGSSNDFALARYSGDPKPNETSNFDTDRQTDIAIWNPSSGNWYIQDSTTNTTRIVYNWGNGALGDKAVPGDYDGDGKTDVAIFRPAEANWYIIKSSDNTVLLKNWGDSADIPVPGDYDLDGKTDTAVFRPSDGNWYIRNSRDQSVTLKGWGAAGDKPVPADYDGDGATDIAVFRPGDGNWYIITSRDRFARVVSWGNSTDKPVPADYDGDGRVDVAVYRDGVWYIRHWTNLVTAKSWGDATDTPVPADYDGDGRSDIAVFRPSDLNWYILQSTTNTGRLGHIPQPGVPVASAYLPQ